MLISDQMESDVNLTVFRTSKTASTSIGFPLLGHKLFGVLSQEIRPNPTFVGDQEISEVNRFYHLNSMITNYCRVYVVLAVHFALEDCC